MRSTSLYLAVLSIFSTTVYGSTTFNLGVASPFAVFAGSTVTSTGATQVMGDVGVYPGAGVSGFAPGGVAGAIHSGDSMAVGAAGALNNAYAAAAGASCGSNLSGQNLGGMTLTSGVYCFSSSAMLGGTLTLDAQGNSNATFVIQTTYSLTTGMGAQVVLANGAQGGNVVWEIGSSANIGAGSSFAGEILANGNINMNTGATLQCGNALSINGSVTLDTNNISVCGGFVADPIAPAETPEPSTAFLVLLVGLPAMLWLGRKYARRS